MFRTRCFKGSWAYEVQVLCIIFLYQHSPLAGDPVPHSPFRRIRIRYDPFWAHHMLSGRLRKVVVGVQRKLRPLGNLTADVRRRLRQPTSYTFEYDATPSNRAISRVYRGWVLERVREEGRVTLSDLYADSSEPYDIPLYITMHDLIRDGEVCGYDVYDDTSPLDRNHTSHVYRPATPLNRIRMFVARLKGAPYG